MKILNKAVNALDATVGEGLNRSFNAVDKWLTDHPGRQEAVLLGGAVSLSAAGLVAEVAARELSKRPTVPAALGRSALHTVAATSALAAGGSAYIAGNVGGAAYARKHPKRPQRQTKR